MIILKKLMEMMQTVMILLILAAIALVKQNLWINNTSWSNTNNTLLITHIGK